LYYNVRPHVAKVVTLSTFIWEVLPRRVFTRLCFFRLSFISIDAARLAEHFKTFEEKEKGLMNELLRRSNTFFIAKFIYRQKSRKKL